VSGNGIAKLRASGIEVTLGLCAEEARALNDAFAKFIRTRMPLVTLKSAFSLDGKIAPAAHSRQPHWLTGPEARAEVHRLRHAQDALLTGIGTVLADDPLLTDRSGLARRRPLLRVVLDTQLRTALNSRIVQTAQDDVLLFCASSAPGKNRTALLEKNIRIETVAESVPGKLDLSAVLRRLGELEILSVLVEAGSHLNSSFLNANLVDKAVLYHSPTLLGETAIPFTACGPTPDALEKTLQRTSHQQFAEDLCVSGYLHDPWV
jgi:diaminohydroxyphosphoribosylaminopyrimidine deaminase/5-amino-6-(5-phosphoribosylamino)uracil reductase